MGGDTVSRATPARRPWRDRCRSAELGGVFPCQTRGRNCRLRRGRRPHRNPGRPIRGPHA